MMKPGPYVVWKRDRYGVSFLRVVGPFQYPEWTRDLAAATQMSGPRAAWWSGLEGGTLLHLASQTIAQEPARLEEPPTTQRDGRDPTFGYAYDDYSD